MSLFTKTGADAAQSAKAEKGDKKFSKFSSGTTYKVRVASKDDIVEYYAHSVYGVFDTTACAKHLGQPDLYDKAVDILYKEANAAKDAGDEKLSEELRNQAYAILAKQRYIRGFFDLNTGKPLVIDLSKKQSNQITDAIAKYVKKIDKVAFELSKSGSGNNTVVSLSPILDMEEDLSDTQRQIFAETAVKAFDHDLFEVLSLREENEQIADLIKFGFDVSKIGVAIGVGSGNAPADGVTPIDDGNDPTQGF